EGLLKCCWRGSYPTYISASPVFRLELPQVVDRFEHEVRIEFNTQSPAGGPFLRGNVDNAISSTTAIKGCSAGTFKYGDRFNVVGIETRKTIPFIAATPKPGLAKAGVVHRDTVDYIQGITAGKRLIPTNHNPAGSGRTRRSLTHVHTSDPAG